MGRLESEDDDPEIFYDARSSGRTTSPATTTSTASLLP
ncbi:hypothetical protein HaLaN_08898 [Haematococcus lacustris]|uniref:Uncharacterized protein n=1 Tax=Haematococcus lacustris TaxID=44745 RepID=A0A699Z0F5_HAELA|nr:hypothetical protein HaLaN_08898 [Haematococcus lacustris]